MTEKRKKLITEQIEQMLIWTSAACATAVLLYFLKQPQSSSAGVMTLVLAGLGVFTLTCLFHSRSRERFTGFVRRITKKNS